MVRGDTGPRADAPDSGRLTRGTRARRLARAALDFLLPRACAVCGRPTPHGDALACGLCLTRLAALPAPRCERCGHPLPQAPCAWCPVLAQPVLAARSVCWMTGGTAGAFVHALKYDGWRELAQPMGLRMARLDLPLPPATAARTAIVAVPLAPVRLRERGYNQSTLLAAVLSRHWKLPLWHDVLERTRDTASQTALTQQQRLRNVADAFSVVAPVRARCRGAHVILVDDVITTGATLNVCAAALVAAGAHSIAYITFGRARAPGDPAA